MFFGVPMKLWCSHVNHFFMLLIGNISEIPRLSGTGNNEQGLQTCWIFSTFMFTRRNKASKFNRFQQKDFSFCSRWVSHGKVWNHRPRKSTQILLHLTENYFEKPLKHFFCSGGVKFVRKTRKLPLQWTRKQNSLRRIWGLYWKVIEMENYFSCPNSSNQLLIFENPFDLNFIRNFHKLFPLALSLSSRFSC